MGNLANFLEFAKVGELIHEEEYCLSRGILSFVGKGWLPSTLLAFILQTKQINRSLSLPVMSIHKQVAI